MIRTLTLGLLLTTLPAISQEPAQPEPEAAGDEAQGVVQEQTADQAEADAQEDGAQAPAQSPHDYRPSEEISEDLSVSFPVDI